MTTTVRPLVLTVVAGEVLPLQGWIDWAIELVLDDKTPEDVATEGYTATGSTILALAYKYVTEGMGVHKVPVARTEECCFVGAFLTPAEDEARLRHEEQV